MREDGRPPHPPTPLAALVLRADNTDERWQAGLGIASRHIADCARLADWHNHRTTGQRKPSFNNQGGVSGYLSRQKPSGTGLGCATTRAQIRRGWNIMGCEIFTLSLHRVRLEILKV